MYTFRIHIRPQGGTADAQTTFNYCLKEGILGVGWRTPSDKNTTVWNEYYEEASKHHNDLNCCKYINRWITAGDLIWTRDTNGNYYLAKVLSGWEYWSSDEAKKLDIDIANIVRCDIRAVLIDAVPGKVVACFRASRTLQEIADDKAKEYSRHLWNKISNEEFYEIDKEKFSDIFMMLDDKETEDIIFLYLQTKGLYVLPSTRKADTMSFEFLCINPENAEISGTQVKTGKSPINKDIFMKFEGNVFLFQSSGLYEGQNNKNTIIIDKSEITDFIKFNKNILPKAIQYKIDLI